MMNTIQPIAMLAGRVLLAVMFLLAGLDKIGGFQGAQAYMAAFGVPGLLLPLVILLEVGGALALIAGLWTRWAALLLAAFTLLATLIFHLDFGDSMQQILFMKNLAITGGLLYVGARGAGAWSLDARRG
ncbi:DoxX family protein [Thioalkalivibrio thiocyanodenitrificans]|uniref:DoxX family protein n=1 Tax=Thioalkalivibrio thiocyanodenitrificans TaxID=243063 RepID=UPI001E5D7C64|nr:DoxX family protein [Thioalkalivibrio thiocyanodenitrificans]